MSSSKTSARQGQGTTPVPTAAIRIRDGRPTLMLENRPVLPLLRDVGPKAAPNTITAAASTAGRLYRLARVELGWEEGGSSDFALAKERIESLLSADAEARFLLEIVVDAPEWWRRKHPAECAVYCRPAEESKTPAPVSWASSRWLTEGGEALMRLLRFVGEQEWSARCFGVQVSAGEAGEWRYPDAERLPDIGPCMTAHFRARLLDTYRRNSGLLRRAWAESRAEFATVTCPRAEERQRADYGMFRNANRSRRLLDYYEAYFDAQNQAALHFCRVARKTTDGRMLIGLSYAPIFGTERRAEDTHAFPEPVLDAPDVDFLANAAPAGDMFYLRALTGSLRLRGKFLFHVATEGEVAPISAETAHTQAAGLVLPVTRPDTELRAASQALSASATGSKPQKRSVDLAIVVDSAGILYIKPPSENEVSLNQSLLSHQMREFARLGVDYEVYLLSDLFHARFPETRVLAFLNTFYLSEAERRQIDARVKRGEKTALWFWSPGVIEAEGIRAEAGTQVCGQKLRLEAGAASLLARIVVRDNPLTYGKPQNATFGLDRPFAPTVTIADKAAERLGSNTANKTVFAVRRYPTWTSLVYGTTPVPARLLRNALIEAGCEFSRAENESR